MSTDGEKRPYFIRLFNAHGSRRLGPNYRLSKRVYSARAGQPLTAAYLFAPKWLSHRKTCEKCGLVVWMRDALGASDHLESFGQAAGIERRIVAGGGAGGHRAQAFVHDPLRGSPLQDTLAPGIIGPIEALQQGFQVAVAGDRDAQHLALDASVEALHHAIGFRRVGPRRAMDHAKLLASSLKPISRKAGAAVGQHMGDLEGEGLWKGKAWTASFRKATALRSVSSSLTA